MITIYRFYEEPVEGQLPLHIFKLAAANLIDDVTAEACCKEVSLMYPDSLGVYVYIPDQNLVTHKYVNGVKEW